MAVNLQVSILDTTVGGDSVASFDVKGFKFLVTNNTDGNIRVTLGDEYDENNSLVIPSESARVIVPHEFYNLNMLTDTLTVHAESASTKGVEVQCLVW